MAISFHTDCITEECIGTSQGIHISELENMYSQDVEQAFRQVQALSEGGLSPNGESVRFFHLAEESLEKLAQIKKWANDKKNGFDNIVSLGIGGSYLGDKDVG